MLEMHAYSTDCEFQKPECSTADQAAQAVTLLDRAISYALGEMDSLFNKGGTNQFSL